MSDADQAEASAAGQQQRQSAAAKIASSYLADEKAEKRAERMVSFELHYLLRS